MRRRASFAVAAAVGAAFVALALLGCTFLISFDEVAEAGPGVPPRPDRREVEIPEPGDDGGGEPPEDSGEVLADANVDYSQACVGKADGKYCNGHGVSVPSGSPEDLVICLGGMTAKVVACERCQRFLSGFPDECDQCKNKANGQYCGDDFSGWHPKNANARVRCDEGGIVDKILCNTCVGVGPNASCQ